MMLERRAKEFFVKIQHDAASELLVFTEEIMAFKEELKKTTCQVLYDIEGRCLALQRGVALSASESAEFSSQLEVIGGKSSNLEILQAYRSRTLSMKKQKPIEVVN